MELCAFPAISNVPVFHSSLAGNNGLHSKYAFLLKNPQASRSGRGLSSRFQHFSISLPRAAASDDSTGISPYVIEERDSVTAVEDSPSAEKNVYNEVATSELSKEEPVEGGQGQVFQLLNELKLESGDAYGIIIYGTGALVGLWLLSAIVGAIDSIPLFPKLLEVVGLGYTLWFTTRFLIFKESRDELAARVEELKKQVLGSEEE